MIDKEITIITPCYNGYQYMEKYWESLEKQTYKNFNVIVVDDCSTDNSFEELLAYKAKSSLKIEIIRNEVNIKSAKTRHVGYQAAKTPWIAFCDCDDWYEYDFLEKMMSIAKDSKADMVMCNFNYVYSDGSRQKLSSINMLNQDSSICEFLAYTPMSLCRFVMKRKLYEGVIVPNIINAEDGAITPQLIAKSKKIASTHEGLYNYFIRGNSLSSIPNKNIHKDFLTAYSIVEKIIYNQYPLECEFIGIKQICYGATLNALKAGVGTSDIKHFMKEFERKYPNWYKNKYIMSMKIDKKTFLFLLKMRLYLVLRIYAKAHQAYIISSNRKLDNNYKSKVSYGK